ncbi:hypothetical protein E2986_12070 [Frieseomelitta varia]|uniref:Uncharacterized protein n=1 Tax=Frieseomelitta varia TaxID=561572 RepID=A0A833SE79_9HYME|nr:hypothetical protein E2986_12070 [Frieseomelitta varia]
MSWVPPNLTSICSTSPELTSCQPQALTFLALITNLFGNTSDVSCPHNDTGKCRTKVLRSQKYDVQ